MKFDLPDHSSMEFRDDGVYYIDHMGNRVLLGLNIPQANRKLAVIGVAVQAHEQAKEILTGWVEPKRNLVH